MDPFPEPWELIGLFECEPELADPGVPWAHNRLRFESLRGGDRIECTISPGYGEIDFRWSVGDRTVIDLSLQDVVGIEVQLGGSKEGLAIATVDPRAGPLQIQLSPAVSLTWRRESV